MIQQWASISHPVGFVDRLGLAESRRLQDPALRRGDDLEVLMQRVRKYEHVIQVLSDEVKMNNDAHASKRLRLERDALYDFKKRWSLK